MQTQLTPLFPLGQLVVTANAAKRLTEAEIQTGLQRHASGDWGDLAEEDLASNEQDVMLGGRIFSAYGAGDKRFWIISEPSVTTVLLPLDY